MWIRGKHLIVAADDNRKIKFFSKRSSMPRRYFGMESLMGRACRAFTMYLRSETMRQKSGEDQQEKGSTLDQVSHGGHVSPLPSSGLNHRG